MPPVNNSSGDYTNEDTSGIVPRKSLYNSLIIPSFGTRVGTPVLLDNQFHRAVIGAWDFIVDHNIFHARNQRL